MRRSSILLALALVAGCSDGNGGPADMVVVPDMSRAPMDHPPLWRLTHLDAQLQTAPEVWTVVWAGDEALGNDIVDFLDWMLHSD